MAKVFQEQIDYYQKELSETIDHKSKFIEEYSFAQIIEANTRIKMMEEFIHILNVLKNAVAIELKK